MPELRKDPITGRWTIISQERAKRPSDFKIETQDYSHSICPFCKGNEHMTPPEILVLPEGAGQENWKVRIVPNKFPALMIEGSLSKRGMGVYDYMNGIGAHEVFIESPEHKKSLTELEPAHAELVLKAYRARMKDLKKDKRLIYGMLFKNVGMIAGASLEHSHSQLIALPTVPKLVTEEMSGAKSFFNYRGRCIFCDVVLQEIEQAERLVAESEYFVAFEPYAARFPFETCIMPKEHQSHFEFINDDEIRDLTFLMQTVLKKIELSLDRPPYNYIIHTAPFGTGEVEHYHWHIEIIPRLTKMAGFEWGTDFYINPVPPENAAKFLREMAV